MRCLTLLAIGFALFPHSALALLPNSDPAPSEGDANTQEIWQDTIADSVQTELRDDRAVNRSPAIDGPATEVPTGENADLYLSGNENSN